MRKTTAEIGGLLEEISEEGRGRQRKEEEKCREKANREQWQNNKRSHTGKFAASHIPERNKRQLR